MRGRVAVVGAGVVGLFTALALSASGFEVTVYEAERPGAGASTRNANVIHRIQPPPGRLRRRYALLGSRLHRVYSRILGYKIMSLPLVVAATNSVEEVALRLLPMALRRLYGVDAVIVRGDRARDVEPALSDKIRAAMVVEGYGVVDSGEVIERLLRELEASGVGVVPARVEALEPGPAVVLEDGSRVRYDYVVNSAGAEAARLASTLGDRFNVRLVPGLMAVYRGPRFRSIVSRLPTARSKGGAIIPQLDGSVIVGPTFGVVGDEGLAELRSRFGGLTSIELGEPHSTIVGLRAVSDRRDFIIARSRREPRVIHLVGIESPGLTAAPAIAEEVASMLGLCGPPKTRQGSSL